MADKPAPKLTVRPGSPVDWSRIHLWHIQPIRDALIVLAVIGILYLGSVLSLVTVPLLLALLLAYLFEPLVQKILRLGWVSRQGAAVFIIFAAALMIGVPSIFATGFAVVQGATVVQRVTTNATAVADVVQSNGDPEKRAALSSRAWLKLADWLVRLRQQSERVNIPAPLQAVKGAGVSPATRPPGFPESAVPRDRVEGESEASEPEADTHGAHEARGLDLSPSDMAAAQIYGAFQSVVDYLKANSKEIGQRALNTGAGALGWIFHTVTSLGFLVFGGFLTAFFFYFFCTGYGQVIAFWESLIPERRKGPVVDLLMKMDLVISGFIRGRLTICFILMVYYTAAYWLIGVPAPLILGPAIGLLALVPYAASIGFPIAALLLYFSGSPMFAFQNEWWWALAGPAIVSAGSQILDDYVLSPAIQGKATGMDTPTILFASLAGGVLAGFYGLLIAIPVAACLKIVVREIVWPRFKAWAEGRAVDPLPISSVEQP